MKITHPCPGLSRFAGTVSFIGVGLGIYYGGLSLLDLAPLEWPDPDWTWWHIGVVALGALAGAIAGLLGFAAALTVNIRNRQLNDLIIVLWQFLANTSLVWVVTIGAAMSIAMGREEAKAAVVAFGAERATLHVVAIGCALGIVLGLAFHIAAAFRVPVIPFVAFSFLVSASTARWYLGSYGVGGKAWVVVGVLVPLIAVFMAAGMIARDHQQRRLAME